MQVSAKAKFVRTSPRKVRLVVDVVRGMKVNEALDQLKFMNKKASGVIMKIVNSAVSNAEHNFELEKDNLFIKAVTVDEAPTLKRWMPRAHGRATTIRKRNSHILLTLSEIKDSGEKKAKKVKVDSPVKIGETPKEVKSQKLKVESTTATNKDKGDTFDKDDKDDKDISSEKGKEIIDPRKQAQGGHGRAEGGNKGFVSKIFRRKSG